MCFCRLEDASLANYKLQQSLKIKEEKITELETKYALTPHLSLLNISQHLGTNRTKRGPYNLYYYISQLVLAL